MQCNVIKCDTLHCNAKQRIAMQSCNRVNVADERTTGVLFTLYMNRKLERQHTMAPLAAFMGPFASYLYEMYDK